MNSRVKAQQAWKIGCLNSNISPLGSVTNVSSASLAAIELVAAKITKKTIAMVALYSLDIYIF